MQRADMLSRIESEHGPWDLVIIGGGATGGGVAIDGASRGYTVLLLEQRDVAKGTSSRSTKLVHGGVRYLQQGHVSLVLEALKPIHGFHRHAAQFGDLAVYGSDARAIQTLARQDPVWEKPLLPRLTAIAGEVRWAVRHETARTVEDFRARRTRALLLDARASMAAALAVAAIMAREPGPDDVWRQAPIDAYHDLALKYVMVAEAGPSCSHGRNDQQGEYGWRRGNQSNPPMG